MAGNQRTHLLRKPKAAEVRRAYRLVSHAPDIPSF